MDGATFDLTALGGMVAAITVITKVLVDGYKKARPTAASGEVLGVGLTAALLVALLLLLAFDVALTTRALAQGTLAAILGWGSAVLVTEWHKAARQP